MEKGQLIFNLKNIETYDPEDFYISKSNFNVSTLLKSPQDWFNRSAVIFGQKKSGKTHLLNIWSGYNNANLINCLDVQNWNDISFNTNIAIDDFHNLKDEEGFFHFYNSLVLEKKTILVTVDINSNFEIKLKDLNSRFKSFTSSKIENPEDDLLKAIIMKYFSNAQVQVDKNVIEYLLKRVDRDYQKLYNILEKINILSLQRKSKITTHLIRDIMT